MSKLLENYLAKLKVYHKTDPLYALEKNELVERFNRVLIEKLNECESCNNTQSSILASCLVEYRLTPHSNTGIYLFEVIFGKKIRTDLSTLCPQVWGGTMKV